MEQIVFDRIKLGVRQMTKTTGVSFALVALASLFTACTGRPTSLARTLPISAFGLEVGKPSVISFSALWCHPCRDEIEALNQASREFGGQIQFVGYLVEGEAKGSEVQEDDKANFKSFSGEAPLYKLATDKSWRLFDSIRAPSGRALPTLVLIDQYGKTREIVQQSLDYQSQMRPLLQALVSGAGSSPDKTKAPSPPAQPGEELVRDTVANWLSRSEVAARPLLIANAKAAWETGLRKLNFTKDEMPFETGSILFSTDGMISNTPLTAEWNEETPQSVCQLTVNFKIDGTVSNVSGYCRPR